MSSSPLQWQKDQFLISTSQDLLQTDVINKAFGEEYMYWTKPMSDDGLRKMLSKSLCFGVYILPEHAGEEEEEASTTTTSSTTITAGGPRATATQIGLGRLITDESTFAYLTDVFIVPEYQGLGLGRWMMECISEAVDGWPDLRRVMLFTRGEAAMAFYRRTVGMRLFENGGADGLVIMEKRGPGSVYS